MTKPNRKPDPDYILDVTGLPATPRVADDSQRHPDHPPAARPRRHWIAMQFRCCGAYARIYLNADRSAYAGHCPKCGQPVRVRTSPTGSATRFFSAG